MKSVIIKPRNQALKKYVQYFLFFKKDDHQALNYTTFPNNNLCLALYKENEISYINASGTNNCQIKSGRKNFVSKLYGFHKMPFHVDINASLDQVCILFYPSALRAFTNETYRDLQASDAVFGDLFSAGNTFAIEEIFETGDFLKRAELLENLLLKKLQNDIPEKLKEALWRIAATHDDSLHIETLSRQLGISDTTLFRLFTAHLGQNPKSYLKTLRFRRVMDDILASKNSLTGIAYQNQYHDQAHFSKDFKTLSGFSPKHLVHKIAVEQNDLAWIYNES